ncbi:GDSL esterase/lipase APG [Linum perenne]
MLASLFLAFLGRVRVQETLVPGLIIFGDSGVDVGNNNYLPTHFKANYPPYGRDFGTHHPTGRFCNGKLVTDITGIVYFMTLDGFFVLSETLGFKTYPPAYLSPNAKGKNLLTGVNFASAASGFDDKSATRKHAITLPRQLELFKEYKGKLAKVAGANRSATIIRESLYILGAGSGDFLVNYYVNPSLKKMYTPDQYGSSLIPSFNSFVKGLYKLGGRRLGVTSLPPLGCFPAARALLSYHGQGCVSSINTVAQQFNNKLTLAAASLQKQLPGMKIVIFDTFKPLYDLVKKPSDFGLAEARRGCCGMGKRVGAVETSVLLCNPRSMRPTCPNATEYVFWDGVHPSEAANRVIADALILQGISLIG